KRSGARHRATIDHEGLGGRAGKTPCSTIDGKVLEAVKPRTGRSKAPDAVEIEVRHACPTKGKGVSAVGTAICVAQDHISGLQFKTVVAAEIKSYRIGGG